MAVIGTTCAFSAPCEGFPAALVLDGVFDRALALAPDRLEVRLNRAIALDEAWDGAAAIAEYRAFINATAKRPEFVPQRNIAETLLSRRSR